MNTVEKYRIIYTKPVYQISSNHGTNSTSSQTQGLTFEGKPKQEFQISKGSQINNTNSSSSQGFSFAAKPKPVFQISSNHQGKNNASGGQGFSYIAPDKPKFVPVSNGIILGASKPEIKKSNPKDFKISSSSQNGNNASSGISYIAPQREKQLYSISSGISFQPQAKNNTISESSQGITYKAPDPPKKKANVQFSGSNSVSLQFSGSGVPPTRKKKKHYEMEWDKKYKKADPKSFEMVSKQINLVFPASRLRGSNALDYIIQQLSQPSQVPNMSVKSFFTKKGRRRGGRK